MKPWMSASTSSGSRVVVGSPLVRAAAAGRAAGQAAAGTGARKRPIVDDVQHRLVRVRTEEHLGRHLVAAQEPLEGRQVARAIGRKAVRGLPDRIQPRQDHLGEFVDVAFPRAVVVADHHQPPAVVDEQPFDEMNRADPDERAGRRQPLREGVDRGHHGAERGRRVRASTTVTSVSWFWVTTSSRKLAAADRVRGRHFVAGLERRGRAQLSSATLEYGDCSGRMRLRGEPVQEPEQRIAVQAGDDLLRAAMTLAKPYLPIALNTSITIGKARITRFGDRPDRRGRDPGTAPAQWEGPRRPGRRGVDERLRLRRRAIACRMLSTVSSRNAM